jgi:hypothetical protein
MSQDVATVRQIFTTAITTVQGWTVSRWVPELFGKDPASFMHHAFAVGIPTTEPQVRDARQRVSEGLLVSSTVEVYWAHQLRGDAQVLDYDAGLDAERDVVGACMRIATTHIMVQRLARNARTEGWLLGTITFSIVHRYSL